MSQVPRSVLGEGSDLPFIECLLLLRPTRSRTVFIQHVGRGLRPFPGKRFCLILDEVGNSWLHGAVDGFVYQRVAPRAVFLISTQLRRSFFARLFFCGIAIARKRDAEDRSQNDEALRECHHVLGHAGELFIFPEGTSSLGP